MDKETIIQNNSVIATVAQLSLTAIVLVGLSACGGSASNPVQNSSPEAVPAPGTLPSDIGQGAATDAQPDAQIDGVPDTPVESGSSGGVAGPDAEFVVDSEVIANAANVGCLADPATFSNTMLQLINTARLEARMCGIELHNAVDVLGWSDQLAAAARAHATDMSSNNFFSHDGSDGLAVSDRADAAGYAWRAVGENIAAGQTDMAIVHQDWLDSPSHCVNVMGDLFTEAGAACVQDPNSDFIDYWVVVFGTPR